MQILLLTSLARIGDVVASLWRRHGHDVDCGDALALDNADFASRAGAAAVIVWADAPLRDDELARLQAGRRAVPLIDLSYLLTPGAARKDILPPGSAGSGYVLCLPAPQAQAAAEPQRTLPLVMVCGDDPAARRIAMELLPALGRKAVEIGPLRALRYMDKDTARMLALA